MNASDSEFQDLVPIGTRCLLIQPVLQVSNESDTGLQKPGGFILLASTTRYAFSMTKPGLQPWQTNLEVIALACLKICRRVYTSFLINKSGFHRRPFSSYLDV